jgi:DNA-binding MarR family transcriptional regulator
MVLWFVATNDRRLLFVLQRASRAAIGHANELTFDTLGVSATQLGILSYLAKHPRSTMTEVANLFDLNKSAVSSMISRLERAGLVTRVSDPKDARSNLVSLTSKGESIRESSIPVIKRVMAEITAGFTASDLDIVYRFLNVVIERCSADRDPESTEAR